MGIRSRIPAPVRYALDFGRVFGGLRGLGWLWGAAVSGGWVAAVEALWGGLPLSARVALTVTGAAILFAAVGHFIAWLRGRGELDQAEYDKWDGRDEFMVYEAAFLWHGYEPPSIKKHFKILKDRHEIERTKIQLHDAIRDGSLEAVRNLGASSGRVRRHVSRAALLEYCEQAGCDVPEFLARVPPRLPAVFIKDVSAAVDDGIARKFSLTVANDTEERASGARVRVTVDHKGSSVTQERTVHVPSRGEKEVSVDAAYPANPALTVEGVIKHHGRREPFCYKYARTEGRQFVPCDEDESRRVQMKANLAGTSEDSGELSNVERDQDDAKT